MGDAEKRARPRGANPGFRFLLAALCRSARRTRRASKFRFGLGFLFRGGGCFRLLGEISAPTDAERRGQPRGASPCARFLFAALSRGARRTRRATKYPKIPIFIQLDYIPPTQGRFGIYISPTQSPPPH